MNTSGFPGKRRHDPILETLVEEYLSENSQLSFISIDDMTEKLQPKSFRYARMKRQAFAALVHKAYDNYCSKKNASRGRPNETSNLQATQSKSIENIDLSVENIDSSDSDIEIEEPPPRPSAASSLLSNLYGSAKPMRASSSQYTYVNKSKDFSNTITATTLNTNKITPESSFVLSSSPSPHLATITSSEFNSSNLPVIKINSNGNKDAVITDDVNGEDSDDLEIIEEVSGDKSTSTFSTSSISEKISPIKAPNPPSLSSDTEDKANKITIIDVAKIQVSLDKDLPKKPEKTNTATSVSQSLQVPIGDSKRGIKRKYEKADQEHFKETSNRKKLKKEVNVVKKSGVKLEDFAGSENVLEEICKLLMHLKHPEVYKSLGVTPPRGFLLHGPPGCGKTLLANAIAGELEMPMLKMAATELVSGVSGESESNIRDLFSQALSLAPCIIFIDEIDSVTPKRETAQREMERRIVAQLLSCIDDLGTKEKGDQVLLIGATNRIEAIDIGLRRAGRFDREICLGIPDVKAREKIIRVICRGLRLKPEFDYGLLAKLTPGYVGADLQALIREAAVQAVNVALTEVVAPIGEQAPLLEIIESSPQSQIVANSAEDAPNISKKKENDTFNEPMETCDAGNITLIEITSEGGDMPPPEIEKTSPEIQEVTDKAEDVPHISKVNGTDSEPMETCDAVNVAVAVSEVTPTAGQTPNPETEKCSPEIKVVTENVKGATNILKDEVNDASLETKETCDAGSVSEITPTAGQTPNPEAEKCSQEDKVVTENVKDATNILSEVNDTSDEKKETCNVGNVASTEIALIPNCEPMSLTETNRSQEIQEINKNMLNAENISKNKVNDTGHEVKETCDTGNVPGYARGLTSLIEKTVVGRDNLDVSSPLRWIKDISPLNQSQLDNLFIKMDDFVKALKTIQPSSKREGFATVPDTTWDDIGALQDIRDELQVSILGPVKHAAEFQLLGLNTPAGVLLCGPPGVGKTLLAKAVANEAGINFISVKGPELLNMYVGESERAVRQCFLRARNSSPCVIFFDELDALCPRRSESAESGSGSRIVNQLLTEMDGMESRLGVFVMAATNRPDIIDPAILRPGRLDKIFFVDFPNAKDRLEILKAITKNGSKPVLDADVNLQEISSSSNCENYTGADLAALVREASIAAFRELVLNSNKTEGTKANLKVSQRHFEIALSKTKPSVSKSDRAKYDAMKLRFTGIGNR